MSFTKENPRSFGAIEMSERATRNLTAVDVESNERHHWCFSSVRNVNGWVSVSVSFNSLSLGSMPFFLLHSWDGKERPLTRKTVDQRQASLFHWSDGGLDKKRERYERQLSPLNSWDSCSLWPLDPWECFPFHSERRGIGQIKGKSLTFTGVTGNSIQSQGWTVDPWELGKVTGLKARVEGFLLGILGMRPKEIVAGAATLSLWGSGDRIGNVFSTWISFIARNLSLASFTKELRIERESQKRQGISRVSALLFLLSFGIQEVVILAVSFFSFALLDFSRHRDSKVVVIEDEMIV